MGIQTRSHSSKNVLYSFPFTPATARPYCTHCFYPLLPIASPTVEMFPMLANLRWTALSIQPLQFTHHMSLDTPLSLLQPPEHLVLRN